MTMGRAPGDCPIASPPPALSGCAVRGQTLPAGGPLGYSGSFLRGTGCCVACRGRCLTPAAAAFFDTLAQFYRKAYLRWIDATKRRPDLRAARIAEVVDLLAAGIKQRPRQAAQQPVTRKNQPE